MHFVEGGLQFFLYVVFVLLHDGVVHLMCNYHFNLQLCYVHMHSGLCHFVLLRKCFCCVIGANLFVHFRVPGNNDCSLSATGTSAAKDTGNLQVQNVEQSRCQPNSLWLLLYYLNL